MTTAPARPTLLGPDGQALAQPAVEDWRPVRAQDNAVVWERPRPAVVAPLAVDDTVVQARAEAEQLLADARAEADQITAEARSLRTRTLSAATSEASKIRERAAADTARREDKGKQIDVWMARAVIAGAVGLTATGEYSLARLAHFPQQVAWLLPFVIDIYVIQAFRRHRDIMQAIGLTIAANVVYHLAAAGMFGVTTDAHKQHHATWWLIAMVASIASVILWRMHVITAPQREKRARRSTGTEPPAEPVPSREPAPVPAVSTAPVPAAEADPGTAPVPVPAASPVPALEAVPEPAPVPVPKRPGTGRKPKPGTAPKPGTSTASFDAHVQLAREWLAADSSLSGTAIGNRLGTGDSYGRRVRRAAVSTASRSAN